VSSAHHRLAGSTAPNLVALLRRTPVISAALVPRTTGDLAAGLPPPKPGYAPMAMNDVYGGHSACRSTRRSGCWCGGSTYVRPGAAWCPTTRRYAAIASRAVGYPKLRILFSYDYDVPERRRRRYGFAKMMALRRHGRQGQVRIANMKMFDARSHVVGMFNDDWSGTMGLRALHSDEDGPFFLDLQGVLFVSVIVPDLAVVHGGRRRGGALIVALIPTSTRRFRLRWHAGRSPRQALWPV